VADANELLAYRAVQPGDSLGDRAAAIRYSTETKGGQHSESQVGDGPLYRLSSMGTLSQPSPIPVFPLTFGVLILVVSPAICLAMIGLRSASSVRQARAALLRALGIGPRKLRGLTFLEGLIVMAPGVVLAGLVYGMVAPHVTGVPLTDTRLVPQDLRLTAVQIVCAIATMCIVCCAATSIKGGAKTISPRPVAGERPLHWTLLVPIGASALLFFASSLKLVSELYTLYPAVLAAVVGVPLLCLFVVQRTGARLSSSENAAIHVVGSTMSVAPRAAAQPFLGVAMLIVLALSVLGWASVVLHQEKPRQPPGYLSTALLYPPQQTPSVIAELGSLDPRIAVVKVRVPGLDGPSGSRTGSQKAEIFADCQQVRKLDTDFDCTTQASSPQLRRQLLTAFKATSYAGVPDFTFVATDTFDKDESVVLALGTQDVETFDRSVRDAVARSMPGVGVATAFDTQLVPNPLSAWIAAGLFTAIAALGLALLLSSVDRHLSAQQARSQLRSLGIRQSTVLQIEGLRVALPLSVVIGTSAGIGAVVCNNMLDLTTPYPVSGLGWTLTAAGLFLVFSVGLVCSLSQRSYFRVAD
jgi:hypothetical protein